ncbi:MAG: adenosine deaminase [Chloroflexi bacterium]|nr:adenosine deaminase [Chloroflexota bacterium]
MSRISPQLREFIVRMPKAELHVHLEGSIRPSTMLRLARENGVTLPTENLTELYRFTTFTQFIEVYLRCSSCLRKPEDYALITTEFLTDAAAQNVKYVEAFLSPIHHLERGMEFEAMLQNIELALREGTHRYGVEMHLIFDINRAKGPPEAERVLELALRLDRQTVVGISIGGDEAGFPPEPFQEAFTVAKRAGLHRVAHAGELAGASSVWGAINALGVERVGHGVRAGEDEALIAYLMETRIPLDMCPVSNVLTQAAPSLAEHPIRRYFESGLLVTVGSDDPAIMGTNLTKEYLTIAEQFGFNATELEELSLNALRASFLSSEEKRRRETEFRQEFAALRSELSL